MDPNNMCIGNTSSTTSATALCARITRTGGGGGDTGRTGDGDTDIVAPTAVGDIDGDDDDDDTEDTGVRDIVGLLDCYCVEILLDYYSTLQMSNFGINFFTFIHPIKNNIYMLNHTRVRFPIYPKSLILYSIYALVDVVVDVVVITERHLTCRLWHHYHRIHGRVGGLYLYHHHHDNHNHNHRGCHYHCRVLLLHYYYCNLLFSFFHASAIPTNSNTYACQEYQMFVHTV